MTRPQFYCLTCALLVVLAALIATGHERDAYAIVAVETVAIEVAWWRRR